VRVKLTGRIIIDGTRRIDLDREVQVAALQTGSRPRGLASWKKLRRSKPKRKDAS